MTGQEDENWYYQQQPQTYDEYGRPVYQQQGYYQQQQPSYDPYGQQPQPEQQPYYQDQGRQQGYYQQQPSYDPYGQQYVQEQQYAPPAPPVAPPPVAPPPAPPRPRVPAPPARPAAKPAGPAEPDEPSEMVGGRAAQNYTTGEFTFVDEEAEETEDVIDWLKFAESRSEVRAERRRKLRNRLVGVVVTLALLAGGGAGYLWFTGKLGGGGSAAAAAGGRQVNVVHMKDLTGKVSTALLVDDEGGKKATVLLVPDFLKLPATGDSTTATVGQALDPQGIGIAATRDGLATVLGAPVSGSWRLDAPFLRVLVGQIGGVKVDANVDVHQDNQPGGKLLVSAGKGVMLSGEAAADYATYQAPTEGRDAQLARFGQVMQALITAMPANLADAQDAVHRMNAVLDPSLPEKALAGVLAQLSAQSAAGHLSTATLTTKPDGTLDEATAGAQVKDILGGTLHAAKAGSAPTRVTIVNASGNDGAPGAATVQITNSGLDLVPSTAKAPGQANSEIRYTDDAKQAAAKSLASALGLPDSAVKKVTDSQNADLVLVLGKDYQVPKAQ